MENMDFRWLIIVGLFVDFVGVGFLSVGHFISKRQALDLGTPKWAGKTNDVNLKLPTVQKLLRQSKYAQTGFVLLGLGFALQLVGNWP